MLYARYLPVTTSFLNHATNSAAGSSESGPTLPTAPRGGAAGRATNPKKATSHSVRRGLFGVGGNC